MADVYGDGNVKVWYVASIANQNAPTTTELNLGLALEGLIIAEGLIGFEATTADVPTDPLNATYDTVGIGRDSYSGTALRLKKQTVGADTVYTTLVRAVTGFVAIRRDILWSTAWTSAQSLEVYPIICGRRKRLAPTKNQVMLYEVPTKIYLPPSPDAVIA